MGMMQNLLLASDQAGTDFLKGLFTVLSFILTAVGTLGVFYAFFLFYLMATASDEAKRRAAKKRVFNTFASILIIVALISFMQVIEISFFNIEESDSGEPTVVIAKVENVSMTIVNRVAGATLDRDTIIGNSIFYVDNWKDKDVDEKLRGVAGAFNYGYNGSFNITLTDIKMDGSIGEIKAITHFETAEGTGKLLENRFFSYTRNGTGLKVEYRLLYSTTLIAHRPPSLDCSSWELDEYGIFKYYKLHSWIDITYLPDGYIDDEVNYKEETIYADIIVYPKTGVYYKYVDKYGETKERVGV